MNNIQDNPYNNGEDVIDGFYGSYLCTVKKPSFSLSSMCYVSGKDIYSTTRAQNYVTLQEFTSFVNIQNSITYMIRSSFNLNYLSLTEDINDKIINEDENIGIIIRNEVKYLKR